jgi:hypothetical protein
VIPFDEREFWARAERDLAGPVDYTVPQSARVWNCLLGGKDYYEADELAADECSARFPAMAGTVRRLRAFTARAARFLAGEAGVRQFLDIGAGLPFRDPVHEVAQGAAPGCRVVYADNDPLVVTFGQALLTSPPPGRSFTVDADLNDPARLLAAAEQAGLDFTRPAAVLLMSVLGHIGDPVRDDDQAARSVVMALKSALPPGSWLAVGDLAGPNPGLRDAMACYNASGAAPYHVRSPFQLACFLEDLDLAGPVLAPGLSRRASPNPGRLCPAWGGLGRKR